MGGQEITEKMRREGISAPPSLVFRALRGLLDRGDIRKVHVARGYVRARYGLAATLFCSQCGKVCEVACPEPIKALEEAARLRGFVVSRYILEVCGICCVCAGRQ